MKNNLFVLLLLLFTSKVFSQVPVSRAINPIAGATWIYPLLDAKGGLVTNNIWTGTNQFANIGVGVVPSLTYKIDLLGDSRTVGNNYIMGSIGIGTTTVNGSTLLGLESTTKGFLLPRMTTLQILAIVSPVVGLTVFNTDLVHICFYDGSGWRKVSHSSM